MPYCKPFFGDKDIKFGICFLESQGKEQIIRRLYNDYNKKHEKKDDEGTITLPEFELYGLFLMSFINTNFVQNREEANFFFNNFGLGLVEPYLSNALVKKIESAQTKAEYNELIDTVIDEIGFDIDSERLRFMNCINYVYNLRGDDRDETSSYSPKFLAYSLLNNLDEYSFGTMATYQDFRTDVKRLQNNNKNLQKITNQLENKEINLTLNPFYEFENIYSAAYISLYEIVMNSNRRINVCHNCGKYFVAKTKKEIYCDLPKIDGSRTCREIAPQINHSKKQEKDPLLHLYRKIYQQKMTQIYREQDEIKKKQMREEFDKWKEATKPKVVSYKRKEIPAVVLEKWLNEKN